MILMYVTTNACDVVSVFTEVYVFVMFVGPCIFAEVVVKVLWRFRRGVVVVNLEEEDEIFTRVTVSRRLPQPSSN